jgi:hypothetical protein
MLKADTFWEYEREAPLLNLNKGFLEQEGELLFDRVAAWPTLAGVDSSTINGVSIPAVEKPDRIFIADAERTFRHKENQDKFVRLLAYLDSKFGDYAQGLGYVSSFLLLTIEEANAIALLSHLNSSKRYIPGYWKHEAVAFATDAYVFQELVGKFFPQVAAHLQKNTIDPATYCQKWFVGLCVHVLPFEVLFHFFEKFFAGGFEFLMKFGLSLIKHLETQLLAINNNPASIFALLRLDPKVVSHDSEFLMDMVNGADEFDFSGIDFESLRSSVYQKYLQKRLASAKEAKEATVDDEIEDCQICLDDFPEVYCKECDLKICENCHASPPSKSTHKPEHRVMPIDLEDEEDEKEEDEEDAANGKSDSDEGADELAKDMSKLNV